MEHNLKEKFQGTDIWEKRMGVVFEEQRYPL